MHSLANRLRHDVFETRRGATLIELLVVIVIFSILAASAIPVIAPLMSNRQTREAARITAAMFTGARNRAMQSGRPVGVVLSRMQGLPEACVTLSYAEVPPPYAGDSLQSTVVTTSAIGPAGTPCFFVQGLSPVSDGMGGYQSTDVGWINSVRVGDLIRFNNQGPYFQLVPNTSAANSNNAQAYDQTTGFYNHDPATSTAATGYWWQIAPLPGGTSVPPVGTYRYQIIRAPMRSAAGAVNLPGATVIDLNFSGFDLPNNQYTSASTLLNRFGKTYSFQPLSLQDISSIVITFNPSGAMDTVWCWDNSRDAAQSTMTFQTTSGSKSVTAIPVQIPYKPISPLHLLIGRRENLPLPTAPPQNINPNDSAFKPYLNWQDLGNLWISIDNKTGTVSTAQNSASDLATANSAYGDNGYGLYDEIIESRRLAIELQRLGGR